MSNIFPKKNRVKKKDSAVRAQTAAVVKSDTENRTSEDCETHTEQGGTGATLAQSGAGKRYRLLSCTLQGNTRIRLYEMGLVEGTEVTVLKKAPLGDPLQISARGYSLCIRAKEAQHFAVEEIPS